MFLDSGSCMVDLTDSLREEDEFCKTHMALFVVVLKILLFFADSLKVDTHT
jgi:hypothetical protein